MINDILDYSALARSGPRLDLAWCGAEDVVCTAAAAAAAVRSAVEIRCSAVAARELELEVDPRRFRQIMDNLIGNAVRFTPAGGQVEVMVERQPDGGARILVRDTGVGIRPEDIPRAFEPFVQLDNAPAGVRRDWPRSGTGLGLPIARGLVEAHGGVLTVESAPGHGTTVAVTLPPERVRATSQGQARVAPHLPGSAEKARRPS